MVASASMVRSERSGSNRYRALAPDPAVQRGRAGPEAALRIALAVIEAARAVVALDRDGELRRRRRALEQRHSVLECDDKATVPAHGHRPDLPPEVDLDVLARRRGEAVQARAVDVDPPEHASGGIPGWPFAEIRARVEHEFDAESQRRRPRLRAAASSRARAYAASIAVRVLPGERVADACASDRADALPALRVVEQAADRVGEGGGGIGGGVDRATGPAVRRVSVRSKATNGFPIAMYSATLISVEDSLSRLRGSGEMHTSTDAMIRMATRARSRTNPGKSTASSSPSSRTRAFACGSDSPSPTKIVAPVASPPVQVAEGLDRGLDAVLIAHQADEADQVWRRRSQRRIRLDRSDQPGLGAVPHDEDVLGCPAALDRHLAERLVRGEDDVGEREAEPLGAREHVAESRPTTLGRIELGAEVVMVEHRGAASPAQCDRRQQQHIRRVARVDDVERTPLGDTPNARVHPQQRLAVLPHVAGRAAGALGEGEAMDRHTVELDVALGVAVAPARADRRHLPAGGP